MEKQFNPSEHEADIYAKWEESGAFTPPSGEKAKEAGLEPFTIIMPPPNANDPLHVGHAMFVSVEDILVRYQRMRGKAALWLPGTDHAGIETQFVFEKKLQKEGKSRFSFDRDTLYQMIWDYVQENSGVAVEQMKRLGASADWSRYRFTLDPEVVDYVLSTFERMHADGLVYRDLRLVNYCTKCGTGFSNLEVEREEKEGQLYTLAYPLSEPSETVKAIEVATTRPETLFGDVAVAVHPEDKRYKELIGKRVRLPFIDREIPIIADEMVDPAFGTGAVKITPYHDFNDFGVWQRHKDEVPEPWQVISFEGKLTLETGEFDKTPITEARKKVLERLEEMGLLTDTKNHAHSVGQCYRCSRVIEPLPLAQFFIRVEPLTKQALVFLDEQKTTVLGAGHDRILRHWLTSLEDWNISRQIVWGIRMPVWYEVGSQESVARSQQEIVVGFLNQERKFVQGNMGELLEQYSFEEIEAGLQTLNAPPGAEFVISRERPGEYFLQETDTFDTWFSSAQWPVVTLLTQGSSQESGDRSQQNLPYSSDDFEFYYPTSVMETAYDILMFWVMRMIMMGGYLTGETPFETVYLHGLVRDEKGQKMSKSKGNVVNPIELVEEYGADALRMALVMSTTPGHDSAVGEGKVKGMRNFANKIWNAARFIKMNRESSKSQITSNEQTSNTKDQIFHQKIEEVTKKVTDELERMKIGQAAETVHNEFWHWYCDECLEEVKVGKLSSEALEAGLQTFLRLIHPFMPFVTEAVWQELYEDQGLLIRADWPVIKC
jgi:valyl-tRNA synthetase